jgi:hypothetical protein
MEKGFPTPFSPPQPPDFREGVGNPFSIFPKAALLPGRRLSLSLINTPISEFTA